MGLSFPPLEETSVEGAVVREPKSDQRKSVWSSEPDISSSGVVERSVL